MRMLADNIDVGDVFKERIADGSLVLFKYGPGTGGDVMLKQLLFPYIDGNHSIYISTHETESDLFEQFGNTRIESDLELVSLVDRMTAGLDDIIKKDRFREEGIMVTDLLELSSDSDRRRKGTDHGQRSLSGLSAIILKQVLPFRMVVDNILDLVMITSFDEVLKRLRILDSKVREKGGVAVVAAPLGWNMLDSLETTLFDAVFELVADNTTGVWKRTLLLKNLKGNPGPPEEWDINLIKDIPEAKSLE